MIEPKISSDVLSIFNSLLLSAFSINKAHVLWGFDDSSLEYFGSQHVRACLLWGIICCELSVLANQSLISICMWLSDDCNHWLVVDFRIIEQNIIKFDQDITYQLIYSEISRRLSRNLLLSNWLPAFVWAVLHFYFNYPHTPLARLRFNVTIVHG